MQEEIYENRFEFRKRFRNGIYKCCFCGNLTTNGYICDFCGRQSNQLFNDKTYKYIIKNESEQIQQVFTPIELLKERTEDNDKKNT